MRPGRRLRKPAYDLPLQMRPGRSMRHAAYDLPMQRLWIVLVVALTAPLSAVAASSPTTDAVMPAAKRGAPVLTGTYGRLDGSCINLATLRGRVVMVVNTASHCGFTNQYAGLESLWKGKPAQGLTVVGVPSRDFRQELPSDGEVMEPSARMELHQVSR